MAAWDSLNSAPPTAARPGVERSEHRPAGQRRQGPTIAISAAAVTTAAAITCKQPCGFKHKTAASRAAVCLMLPPCRTNAAIQHADPTRRQHVATCCDLSALRDFDSHGLKTQLTPATSPNVSFGSQAPVGARAPTSASPMIADIAIGIGVLRPTANNRSRRRSCHSRACNVSPPAPMSNRLPEAGSLSRP